MPESQLLIGLETSFKKLTECSECQHILYIKAYIWFYSLPLAYGLYACENIDNYGLPLNVDVIFDLGPFFVLIWV